MDSSASSKTHKCSVCQKEGNLVCKGCKNTPDSAGSLTGVYYCGASCQKDDWSTHKILCKMSNDRRALYRAGGMLQQLYSTYSRYTQTWLIGRIEKAGNVWVVFDGPNPHGTSALIPFPDALFPDPQDKKSILAWRGCNDAISYLHITTKERLKGEAHSHMGEGKTSHLTRPTDIYIQVEEISVKIKNAQLTIMKNVCDNVVKRFISHNVLRVTLRNSEVYALDMTAAQYGWHGSAVMPWRTFCDERVERINEVRSFGKTAETLRAAAQVAGGGHGIYQWWNENQTENVNRGLGIWQQENFTSLKDMLRCSEEEFKTKQDSFLGYMRELMSTFKVDIHKVEDRENGHLG